MEASTTPKKISLTEHQSKTFACDFFPPEIEFILDYHPANDAIKLEPPAYRNQHKWKLTTKGQIGIFKS